jgi:hypothetical protein
MSGSETVRVLLEGGTLKLSGFQLRSLVHLVSCLRSYRDSATIVGAGTGSGKTKAFYLPALAILSENLAANSSMWTRILALYPRVELVKRPDYRMPSGDGKVRVRYRVCAHPALVPITAILPQLLMI